MTGLCIKCDGCGAELDCETNHRETARQRARSVGWYTHVTARPVENFDLCPACTGAGLKAKVLADKKNGFSSTLPVPYWKVRYLKRQAKEETGNR